MENLSFIGEKFRRFFPYKSHSTSNAEIAEELISQCIFIHCENAFLENKTNSAKYDLLCMGIRKLYNFVEGKINKQLMDTGIDCQEVITVGHIFASIVRNGLKEYLRNIQINCLRYFNKYKHTNLTIDYNNDIFENISNPCRIINGCIGERIAYFMNTGNLPFIDRNFKQKSGWSINADRINYFRFLSHFRAVHRGSFWTEMRTTTVRKLRPEAWGFMCPVHTPDGSPCGLLNHLTEPAQVVTHYYFNTEGYAYAFVYLLFV